MRDIKFRAWDKDTKQMIKDFSVRSDGYLQVLEGDGRSGVFMRQDFLLMQYTGLKDKNGVEIYHKDLVSNGTNVFEVVWAKRFGGWAIVDRKTVKQQHHLLVNSLKYQEVIGNLYEHGHLLEANQ